MDDDDEADLSSLLDEIGGIAIIVYFIVTCVSCRCFIVKCVCYNSIFLSQMLCSQMCVL